eukprot:TRINITY_DN4890_c0_g2_i1.p1 TRINITY_DN4890_c0_g2~~TRINITY_DN4890_c0_g2_i1.p1  ORF type:complete len:1153 (+),score=328.87 TRINITY_DN4890_c0_g2_i1:129-3587(+)
MPYTVDEEPFPDVADGALVLICVFIPLSFLVLVGSAAQNPFKLSLVLAAAAAFALLIVGIASWGATYTAARRLIIERTDSLLDRAMELAQEYVEREIQTGALMLETMRNKVRNGELAPRRNYPEAFVQIGAVWDSFGRPASVDMFYYGWPCDGDKTRCLPGDPYSADPPGFVGIALPKNDTLGTALIWMSFYNGTGVPAWITCRARDAALQADDGVGDEDDKWAGVAGRCAALKAGAGGCSRDPIAHRQCRRTCDGDTLTQAACGAVESEYVRVQLVTGRFDTKAGLVTISPEEAPGPTVPVETLAYSPTARPWWTASRTIVVSEPYVFAGSATGVGITISAGMYDRDDVFVGVQAVDFTLSSLQHVLHEARPTRHSAIYIAEVTRGALISSSLSVAAMEADTGFGRRDVTYIPAIPENRSSVMKRAFDTITSKYDGTLETAWNFRTTVHRHGNMYKSLPIDIKYAKYLLVLTLPYSDAMGQADEASLDALGITIGVSIVVSVVVCGMVVVLLAPLNVLAGNMHAVAAMRLDVACPRSRVAEVAGMQKSFATMVERLTEFRDYLPQSLLVGKETEDGQVECEVAVVFTDIRSSAALWNHNAGAMADALRLHNRILRARIEEFDGFEVKTVGDAFMVTFPVPDLAVGFGLCIQRDLLAAAWPEEVLAHPHALRSECGAWNGIQVRVGVNYGTVRVMEERGRVDYLGPVVNVAARIEGQCVPGALCVPDTVLAAVCLEDVGQPVAIEMGTRELKGVGEELRLHLLVPADMEARVEAVREALDGFEGKSVSEGESIAAPARRGRQRNGSILSVAGAWSDVSSTESSGGSRGSGFGLMRPNAACREFLDGKRCTVARTLFQFPAMTLTHAPDPLRLVQDALDAALTAAKATHGTLHALFGAAMIFSWQQVRGVENVSGAFTYVALLGDALRPPPSAEEAGDVCAVMTGVANGRLLAGNVGSAGHGQRFTTVLGPPLALAELLCEGCAALQGAAALFAGLGTSGNIIIEHPRLKTRLRPVDRWAVEEGGGMGAEPRVRHLTVYQIRPRAPPRPVDGRNPLDAVSNGEGDVGDAAEWGEAYWQAFEAGALGRIASADPVVAAVQELQRSGGCLRLRPAVPVDVLGLYDDGVGVRAGSVAPAGSPLERVWRESSLATSQ